MRKFKRVLSFRMMRGKSYFYYTSGSAKRITRGVVRELEKVFIQKKTNEEFD